MYQDDNDYIYEKKRKDKHEFTLQNRFEKYCIYFSKNKKILATLGDAQSLSLDLCSGITPEEYKGPIIWDLGG